MVSSGAASVGAVRSENPLLRTIEFGQMQERIATRALARPASGSRPA